MRLVDRTSATVRDEPFRLAVRTALEAAKTAPPFAVKVALLAPASTSNEGGTMTAGLLLASDTTAPPASAAWVNVTVQLLEEPDPTVIGLQSNEETAGPGAVKVTDAVAFAPFRLAVRTAMEFVATVPAVAVKLAEVAPADTDIAAGTTRAWLLLDNATLIPPEGAALVRVTVQVLVAPEAKVVGLHVTEASANEADKVIETVWDALPRVAVRTAVPSDVRVPAVAEKLAEVAPANTVTAAGTPRAGLLLESATLVPPEGAALVRLTLQALAAPEPRVVGLHVTEANANGADKVNETVCVALPRVAVSSAVPSEVIVPAVALKLAEVAPANTVTATGTPKTALLLVSPTLVPPEGAALVRLTLHALVAPEAKVVGVHATEASATGADKVNGTVWEALPRVAVSTAVASNVIVPAVALKLAEVLPAGTVTAAGTPRA